MVIMGEEEARRAGRGRADGGQGRGPRQTQTGCTMTWGRQRAESANGRHCLVGRSIAQLRRGLGVVETLSVGQGEPAMERRDWYAPGGLSRKRDRRSRWYCAYVLGNIL